MPTLIAKLSNKKPAWLDYETIVMVLIIKVLVLFIGYQSYQLALGISPHSLLGSLEIWRRWDAIHYLNLAQNGYTNIGESRFLIVFFPLYPALVFIFNSIIKNYLLSAFLVSGAASLALALSFKELVRQEFNNKIAKLAVLFLFIFPTSYFLHIPYTESLFLFLVVSSFLFARKRMWVIAGITAALACFTRVNGLILIPALIFESWDEYLETKKLNKKWLGLLLAPFGFIGYLILNHIVTKNSFTFLVYQREHWYRYFRVPWEGIRETVIRLNNLKVIDAQLYGWHELAFVLIGFFAIVLGWKYLRPSYKVWMILNWLLFVSTSFVLSVPRYTLTLFPIFILMAVASVKYRWLQFLFIAWSLLYLSFFVSLFAKGWWAF